jgi:hypothetical protein
MRALFLVISLILVASNAAWAINCPIGSFPWVDNWGNQVCQRFGGGGAAITQTPQGAECPNGSYPWTDNWGNRICRSFNGGTDYYDTSHGCPTGFAPWVDQWGNPVCRRM